VYDGATLLLGPRAFDGVSTQALQRNLKAATPFIDQLFAHSQPALGVTLRATEVREGDGTPPPHTPQVPPSPPPKPYLRRVH
jgi:hypothetical protein